MEVKTKHVIFWFIILISLNLSAQENKETQIFSSVSFGILGGPSFNSIPTAGSSFLAEVKSNVTSNINVKLSIGYSKIYDDNSYEVKSYRYVNFDNYSKYHTQLLSVDRVEYVIIPLNIGAEYILFDDKITPFATVDLGYDYSSSKAEGKDHDGIAGTYDTISDIPIEYRKIAPTLDDGSSYTMGLGLGVKYMLSDRMDLNIRYVYHYNKSTINSNQILFGITF